jgi:endogenous inhibitor of DNA gyrase (YacG/DUF329 family)
MTVHELVCDICQKPFWRTRRLAKSCSGRCKKVRARRVATGQVDASIGRRRHRKEHLGTELWIASNEAPQPVKLCVNCGAIVRKTNERARFCSEKCQNNYHSRNYARRQTAKYAHIPRELGTRQRMVLRNLRAHGGTWYEGNGWHWDDQPSIMEKVLRSLVKRGLVAIDPGTNPPTYRLVEIAS